MDPENKWHHHTCLQLWRTDISLTHLSYHFYPINQIHITFKNDKAHYLLLDMCTDVCVTMMMMMMSEDRTTTKHKMICNSFTILWFQAQRIIDIILVCFDSKHSCWLLTAYYILPTATIRTYIYIIYNTSSSQHYSIRISK